jgi:signal transduction histidine kinase
MGEASDFEHILSLLTEGLKTVELSFDGCEIDVLDEPVENPTMALFEGKGFRYTTYTLDPNGRVASDVFALAAPFPTVNRRAIERFIENEPWQGTSDDERLVEVPAGRYGRLRLTATNREPFTDDEIATLREFADAVALGYARYLDIRQIQEATQRKSAFLASMSHELRTPMNAIKGFTSLVIRRIGDSIPDQHKQNLGKVIQASDHLLAMINDLLDLSKIEAGHMDVNASQFDVGHLVDYCVSTVSPLVQEGVILSAEIDEGIGEAHTDEARLRQMLINLASNAIKFTDSGRVTVKAKMEDGQLELSVSDTGKGIPQDELVTIFDEYRQVKGSDKAHKGTGLGLSITKKFAELLGGSVGVVSEVGKGSVFTVEIPVVYQGEI